ncbi:hypothetical protein BC829DRAFT_163223 [Chytridium lagenaria]|nr:hypothetical protein BC829DRAFT_163223 [Chytridium lagenaria]
MLFLQVDDTGAHARELGNLGALWVEVGKTLRNLQWSREAHLAFAQVVDSGDAEVKMNKAYMAPSTGIPVRTNSGRRGRPVAPQEIESQPGKVYRVGIPYSGRGNDLGINLKAGDKVTVVLLMDDKTTVLGQTAGGLQGTFPISCLLHDVEEDAGGSTTNIAPAPPAPGAFGDYMELMDRYLEHLKGVPELNGSVGGDEEGGHCGTPYVEFGLGMLRDVVQLGAETNEVAVNIAVAEVMLNQPYRAIASLLKLVEGPRSGSKSSSSTPRRIPSSLHKYASLALSSSFLILALSNEDETGSSLYNPDGSDRFAGRGTVDSRRLNLLLSGLGVPSSIQELEKITRADVFPILSNVRGSGGDFHIGGVSAPVSGTMDGVATCILGVLEWITGLWIRDLDAEESGGWMDRGAKKVAEAVDKHVIAVKLVDEAGRRGGSRGLDDPNIKGDASVFTIAAGLRYLEAAIGRLNDKQVGRSDSVSSISSSSSLTHSAGASRSQLLVWSWAVNNTRLQVCSKCAPKALRVSVTGDASGALSHTSDVFPCEHLRASAVSPQADSKAPVVISSTTPSISTVSEKKGDGDLVAEAAEEVVAKMIRRVSAGRLWSRGKAGRDAPTTPTTATQPVPANRRSSIRKEPLWKYESKENAKPNTPLGDDDLVEVLKYALKGLEENVMDKEREASGGRRAARTTPSWINMFYEDATAAVKHLNGIRAEEGGKGRLEQVVEDGEEEGDEQLPMYHPSEAVMVSGV